MFEKKKEYNFKEGEFLLIDKPLNWTSFDVVIALGNEASKALTKENIPHLKIPHPSGKNYLLNDKKVVDKFLKQCRDYIGEHNAS